MSIYSIKYSSRYSFIRWILFFILIYFLPFTASGNENYKVGSFRTFDHTGFETETGTLEYSSVSQTSTPDTLEDHINEIHNMAYMVEDEGRFIDRLDALYQVTYPIGISKIIAGQRYTIVLNSDEITPEGAFINAYMSFSIPQTGRQIALAAYRIPLSADGGLNGVVEMALLTDEAIDLGSSSRLIIKGVDNNGTPHTKVRFDCNGFIDMVVDASVEFNPNIFVVEDPQTGEQLEDESLAVNFNTTIQSWSDMMVEVSLPPFQLKQLKGFGFEVQQASFDFSDMSNPAGMVFPENYQGLENYGDLPELWQGFYLRQLTLRLPPELNEGERLTVMAQHLIIDEIGFSGIFAVENLVSLENGTLGGWAFSIDQFALNIEANSLTQAGLSGKINMPLMDSTSYMDYTALIDQQGDFLFSVSMPGDLSVPLLAAEMTLYSTSNITIQKEDDEFAVLATLNGKIDINAALVEGNPSKGFKVENLKFENMQIGSMQPYFLPGIWSLGEAGVSSANGFSLTLSNVVSFEQGNDVGLSFNAAIKLSGDKYVASTTLKIIGTRYSEVNGNLERHKLRYKKTEFQDLYICVNDNAISLEGYLAIYRDDPVYGNGFAGAVRADIIDKIGVDVKACFGEVNGFKYWYVDALVNLSAVPIAIAPGLSLFGIGGGAYHHMSQATHEGIPFSDANIQQVSNSINYTPDNTVFLGFKATVAMGTPSPQGFNAVATLEIVFNQNWGVNEVMFYGQGSFMQSMDFDNPTTSAPIQADVYVGMDFVNDVFYGNFKVYVNACNGALRGTQANNLAGEMVIYADPVDWYVHIGRPSARIGLAFEILGLTIQNGSYFMMGTQIEEMPSPPEQVLRILEIPVPDNRNTGEIALARGFAFGTYFSISTGDQNFGIFYASFDMGVGFDVMLSDMGETYCVETGEKIGVNGWYAQGQLYAFLEGTIGIDIDVFGVNIHQGILDIGAAVLLETKLPNPFWMRGTVGGYYSLLGGRISGNCRFQLELGQLCTLQTDEQEETSPVEGLAVISELTPGDGRTAIDVFSTPQVVFNYQIGSSFKISDEVNSSEQYKVVLDYFNVKEGSQAIIGTYEWNQRADVLVFNPRDILPGETAITLEAQVHFEKYSGGSWQVLKENNVTLKENMTAVFETGEAPDYIPESNVAHSYPLPNMMNLYRNEFSNGHIQLNMGQAYLFDVDEKWVQYGRFTPVAGGEPIYVNFTYNATDKKINHIIPASLPLNTIYCFELLNLPAEAASGIDANIVQESETSTDIGGDITKTGNIAESERDELQEKVIYTCYFRTSKYNSLSQKIGAIQHYYSIIQSVGISPDVFNLRSLIDIPEPFDKYELVGDNDIDPLLKIWADKDGEWIANEQYPLIYADYPIISGAVIRDRDTAILGLVPVRAVTMDVSAQPYRLLSNDEKMTGQIDFSGYKTYSSYSLSPVTYADILELISFLALSPIAHPRKTELLTQPYPSLIVRSTYPVYVKYWLPFTGQEGTQNTMEITY